VPGAARGKGQAARAARAPCTPVPMRLPGCVFEK